MRAVLDATFGAGFDLVEAAIRSGLVAEAQAQVRALQKADVASLSPRLAFLVVASAALVAEPKQALSLFEAALSTPGVARWPFDLARVRLVYGEVLRRAGAVVEARAQLAPALEAFDRLGVAPWRERAVRELGACRQRRKTRHQAAGELTSQEHEVALLAATGLSNKQIAAHVFLSPRTVGGHLYHVYPKLGITSRAGLRDALAALDLDRPMTGQTGNTAV